MKGLIFGGAYLRREICVFKSIGPALKSEINLPFLPCFTLYLRAIFQAKTPGGLYLEERFNGGCFALPLWGLMFGGVYVRNFTVLRVEFVSNESFIAWLCLTSLTSSLKAK